MVAIKEKIKKRCVRYYSFASLLNYTTYLMMNLKELQADIPYLICLNTFSKKLASYTFSVYQDLSANKSDPYCIKAETNRVMLRGCLEATLIADILINNPKLEKNFYDNLYDDIKRINKIYNDSAKNRNKFYSTFNEEDSENTKFAKRYAWLPKHKKKRANSMKDLLNYIDDLNEFDTNYYEVLIKALDLYAHPSFYLSNLISNSENNLKLVDIIFLEDGIIYQIIESLIETLDYINNKLPKNQIQANLLASLKGEYEAFDIKNISNDLLNSALIGNGNDFNKKQIAYYFSVYTKLEESYLALSSFLPESIHELSHAIKTVSLIIANNYPKNYKNITLKKLLDDLYPRYDDMIISYFRNDIQGFYGQCRYIIEAVATLYIIFDEDEERSHVYHVHQDIKGYDFQQVSAQFNQKATGNSDQFEKIIEENKIELLNNINFVRDYYIKKFNTNFDDATLTRLNGWALFLRELDNDKVPNAPALINYAVSKLTVNLPDILAHNINFSDFSLGLYEESCAYSHVTSYAWYNSIYALKDKSIFKQQFIVANLLVNLIVNLITDGYDFESTISSELLDQLDHNFNMGMSRLLLNYIK